MLMLLMCIHSNAAVSDINTVNRRLLHLILKIPGMVANGRSDLDIES